MNTGDLLIARCPTKDNFSFLLVLKKEPCGRLIKVMKQDGETVSFTAGSLDYCYNRVTSSL